MSKRILVNGFYVSSLEYLVKEMWVCWYCGRRLTRKERSRDHIVPKSQGGRQTVDSCKPCNTAKANMSLEAFRILRYNNAKIYFHGETFNIKPYGVEDELLEQERSRTLKDVLDEPLWYHSTHGGT